MAKQKIPRSILDFRIALYGLKQYKNWTDEDVAKRLGITSRTVTNMRKDPFSTSGAYILRVQEMYEDARREYVGQ